MVVEERLKKQSSDSNPTPLSCWVNGWDAGSRYSHIHEMLIDIETHRVTPNEGIKDALRRSVDVLINNSVNTGCRRFNTERIAEFKGRLLEALNKEDWREVGNALYDIAIALY